VGPKKTFAFNPRNKGLAPAHLAFLSQFYAPICQKSQWAKIIPKK
jgi:hypothetical protein